MKRAYLLFADAVDWPNPRFKGSFYAVSEKKALEAADSKWFHVYCPATGQIFGREPGFSCATEEYKTRIRNALTKDQWARYVDGVVATKRKKKKKAHNPTNPFDLLRDE